MGLFHKKKDKVIEETNDTVSIKSKKGDIVIPYREAVGFFMFHDTIYYKPNGGSGKSIYDNSLFSENVKKNCPDFDGKTSIGLIDVTPLTIIK